MKSKPFKSPWGIHKTRCALHSRRIERALEAGPMPKRYFGNMLARFSRNWSDRNEDQ